MSSLRGLGAGITKFFTTTTSVMGSRTSSLTPPPSEIASLTANSMVSQAAPPAGSLLPQGAGGLSSGGAPPPAVSSGVGGGCSSSGGASSAGTSVPPSPGAAANSVLGVSPSALATRMRLIRSPVPPQAQGPLTVAPSSQEMSAAAAAAEIAVSAVPYRQSGGGSEAGSNVNGGGAASHAPPAVTIPAHPQLPPAAAGTPHHYRVAHMRTITEENLDLLLRPGSSGGVELLGVPTPTTPTGQKIGGAGDSATEAALRGSPVRRKVADLLGSTDEGPDGGEADEHEAAAATAAEAAAAAGSAAAPGEAAATAQPDPEPEATPAAAASPFANCGALAGSIAQEGVAAPGRRSSSSGGGAAPFAGAASAPLSAARSARASEAGSFRGPRTSTSGRSITPPQLGAWAQSPGMGPAGGAQVGAGDVLAVSARYLPPTAPEDLRLVLSSPRRVSSAGASADGPEPGANGWPGGDGDGDAAAAAVAGHGGLEGRRVAYHWWKALPEESLQKAESIPGSDLDGYDGWKEQPLLAKPSVRFRKTINADNPAFKPYGPRRDPNERAKVAVNAQHYAILVTDVTQWPYPELQRWVGAVIGPTALSVSSAPAYSCPRPRLNHPTKFQPTREYEARYQPSLRTRFVHWLRRVPRIVSRPGAELFGLRADGDSDVGSAGSASPLAPGRSLEVGGPRGGQECAERALSGARESPHVADDLEAAVETIENAKAKVGVEAGGGWVGLGWVGSCSG